MNYQPTPQYDDARLDIVEVVRKEGPSNSQWGKNGTIHVLGKTKGKEFYSLDTLHHIVYDLRGETIREDSFTEAIGVKLALAAVADLFSFGLMNELGPQMQAREKTRQYYRDLRRFTYANLADLQDQAAQEERRKKEEKEKELLPGQPIFTKPTHEALEELGYR